MLENSFCSIYWGEYIETVTAISLLRGYRWQAFGWLRGRDSNPRPSGYEPDELTYCSTPQYVRGSTKCGDRTFLLFLYGKKWENLRLQFLVATPLMTLCFSHFIHLLLVSSAHACLFTTPAQGSGSALFTLNEHLLDYLSTTNLAGCSWLLRQYSFNSIKYTMLVTPHIPHSYLVGLRRFSLFATIDFYF